MRTESAKAPIYYDFIEHPNHHIDGKYYEKQKKGATYEINN